MENLQDKAWLKQKYVDENLSMSQIGALLGVTKHPVYRALKKHGLQARTHTSKYPELNDKAWLKDQYITQRKSVKQIAGEIHATVGTVHSALTHMGVRTRGPKESLAIMHEQAQNEYTTSQNYEYSPIGKLDETIHIADKLKIKLQDHQEKYDKLLLEAHEEGALTGVAKSIEELLKEKSGIRLDIGCGKNKQPGFVGMDYRNWGNVDIIHNLEETPWPLPDNCVITAVASHVLEHIDPHNGIFINVMDEIWRVMQPDGQFAFVVPYAGSPGYWQDPTHCNGITESTLLYFDPDPEGKYAGQLLYGFYEPKPWKIEKLAFSTNGNLECVLRKRRDDKSFHQDTPNDIVEEVSSNARIEEVKKYFSDNY